MVTFEDFSIGHSSRGIGAGALRASGTGNVSPRVDVRVRIVGMQSRACAFVTEDDR